MKEVKKTTTTIRMRHRTVVLLLLILIAYSSASCNVESIVLDVTENTNEPTAAPDIEKVLEDTETPTEAPTETPTEDATEPEKIIPYNEEIEAEIQEKYWLQYIGSKPDYAGIPYEWATPPYVQFYGQFGNAYMVYLWCDDNSGRIGAYFVEGYEFRYEGERQILAYKNGLFYTLEESLEHNLINLNDLETIHSEFKEINNRLYKQIYVRPFYEHWIVIPGQIQLEIQPQYNDKEYSVEDFEEIGCIRLEEGFLGEPSPNVIYRYFNVYVEAETEEELLNMVKILEKREDIFGAWLLFDISELDSLPNDIEYGSSSSDNYWAINKISLPQAWDEVTGNSSVIVGSELSIRV